MRRGGQRVAGFAGILLCMLALVATPAHADLEKIRKSGTLKVAVYDDFAPFSKLGKGIDVDLGDALAKKLGLKLSLLSFPAGENLNDDLRNMVWKGHYLGYGPADVLLHVPIDLSLSAANPQVKIFSPYHTETVRLVRNVQSVPKFDGLSSVAGKRIGVEKISIGAMVLLGEDGGRYSKDLKIFPTGVAALEGLKSGEVDAVLANRSEIENVLRDDPRFEMREVAFQRLPRKGWTVGMAVRSDDVELGKLLQDAMDELFASGEMIKIFAKYGVQIVRP
ncbi:MAG: transporter substrate-binding domain-containing protein [Herminiimonas sp.]|nr:transporter substrate-binding domain-containing protein [Herminiimonas sp.]